MIRLPITLMPLQSTAAMVPTESTTAVMPPQSTEATATIPFITATTATFRISTAARVMILSTVTTKTARQSKAATATILSAVIIGIHQSAEARATILSAWAMAAPTVQIPSTPARVTTQFQSPMISTTILALKLNTRRATAMTLSRVFMPIPN